MFLEIWWQQFFGVATKCCHQAFCCKKKKIATYIGQCNYLCLLVEASWWQVRQDRDDYQWKSRRKGKGKILMWRRNAFTFHCLYGGLSLCKMRNNWRHTKQSSWFCFRLPFIRFVAFRRYGSAFFCYQGTMGARNVFSFSHLLNLKWSDTWW